MEGFSTDTLWHDKNENRNEKADQLWSSLCKGNREALDQLFRFFYKPLLNYGLKIKSDREIVKDSIQELFLMLWKKHASISQAKSVDVYLLLSLRRILLRKVKKQTAQSIRDRQYLEDDFTISFSIEEIIIDEELKKEKQCQMLKALNSLNGRQKESLFLRYYHGLSNQEIADVMGINHQSVRNNLSRALQSLRAVIQSAPLYE